MIQSKKVLSVFLVLIMLFSAISSSFVTFAEGDTADLSDIVKFGEELVGVLSSDMPTDFGDTVDDDEVSAQSEDNSVPTRLIVKSDSSLDDMGAVSKINGPFGINVFQYKNEGAASIAYHYYLNNKNVDFVEYDKKYYAQGVSSDIRETDGIVGNHLSWGADVMGIDTFISELPKDPGNVTVAVIDTGIDTGHPLFGGFYDDIENPDGRILKNGQNFSEDKSEVPFEDNNGHGTHVSGTVVDLTPDNVKILPVKVLDSLGSGYSSSIAAGILYAAYSGADIINMSFGGMGVDSFVDGYVIDIAYGLGCLPVAAAGNEFSDASWSSPGLLEKCITVGSLNEYLALSSFSNYGKSVDICAPGEYIISACMGGGYISFDGTSMATPHVSALASLYLSKNPSFSAQELSTALTSTAVDLGENGKDFIFGCGLAFAKSDSLRSLGMIDISFSEEALKGFFNPNSPADSFENPTSITLSCEGADSLYYTLDGTDPLSSSTAKRYEESFTVSNTSRLRVIALNGSKKPGMSIPLTRDIFIADSAPKYRLITDGTKIVSVTGILPSEYTVPSPYTVIGDYAFANHRELNSITFSDSVTDIGEGAFLRCELSGINLCRVKNVGRLAFAYGSYISEFSAPEVLNIGSFSFAYNEFSDAFSFPKAVEIGDFAFFCSEITEISFPDVRTIGNHAFFATAFWGLDDDSRNMFSAPKTESVGEYAFAYSLIDSLSLPLAKSIGKYAFANSYVSYVNLPLIERINDYTFYSAWLISSFDIPKLRTVGDYAFTGCEIEKDTLPLVESVGEGAFMYSYAPNGLSLPKLTKAGDRAFESFYAKSVSFPKLTEAGKYAFAGLSTEDLEGVRLDLPELIFADDYAFSSSSFTSFNVPKLRTIGNGAFMYCYNLENISLPSAESIGSMAFCGTLITSVKLPDSIKYIGANAFNSTPTNLFDTTLIASENSYTAQYAKENGYRFIPTGTVFTVTFINAYGREISVQNVPAGDSATAPKAPYRFAQTFLFWDTNFSCVCDDLTVSPVYASVFAALRDKIITFFLELFGFYYY